MKRYLYPIILFMPLFTFAQSNYKPGYIVDLKGDTLKGTIDYKEWEKNPRQVSFQNNTGVVQVYTTQNAKAFAVSGLEYYEKYIVSVSTDPVEVNDLKTRSDADFVKDTVFLKVLARGKYLSLYYYADNIKPRFYLSETGDTRQPEELVYHVNYNADRTNTIHITRYRTQLQYEAQKNNGPARLESLINQARYDADDLIKIVTEINGGAGQQMVSENLFGTRWFAGAGVNYNDMLFTGSIAYGDAYSLFPKVSAGLDMLPNKSTQRFFLRAEAAFTGDSHDFKNTYQKSELNVSQLTASAIFQAYYNFYNGQKLKIFAGGGIAVNFSAYPVHYYIVEGGIDLAPVKSTGYPDYHTLWESVLLKAGIILNKKIEIYAGYSPPTTLTNNYIDFAGNVISYQAGVNFLFGAK